MEYLKRFNEGATKTLSSLVNDGQYFLALEDEGFYIDIYEKDAGKKQGIQSSIKIYKSISGQKLRSNSELIEFDFEEIRGDVIRFIEMSDKEIHYIYADKIGGRSIMLYDPNEKTHYETDGTNKVLDDSYELGLIIKLDIVYGLH